MQIPRNPSTVLLLASLALACSAGPSASGSSDPAERVERQRYGERLFGAYCAACHGADAHGEGPAAAALATPPADLTWIAARRGGRFDAAEVAAYIDGRNELVAHGRGDMPVWGRLWDDRNQELAADETLLSPPMIFAIVSWLRSIQQGGERP